MTVMDLFRKQLPIARCIVLLAMGILLQSCFTGIENTGYISMSKHDRELDRRQCRDEAFMDSIVGEPANRWNRGKRFRVIDDRSMQLFDSKNPIHKGQDIYFNDLAVAISPGGTERLKITFITDDFDTLAYVSSKVSADEILSSDLSMLIDMDMVNALDKRLKGHKLWTRTLNWEDSLGIPLRGRKFEPVTITRIDAGTESQPFFVEFVDELGENAFLHMTLSHGNLATRPFHTLFSLSDPKKNYPRVTVEHWEAICRGNVTTGMTKEECKLALGYPSDIDSWHDYSKTIETWSYDNGIFLRFEDGLLVYFRK